MSTASLSKPKIAISACLLGEEVRYNGGHKESRLCSRTLTEYFDFVPLCPEVAIGMGIPREPIRLVGDPEQPEAVGTVDRTINVTRPLAEYGEKMAAELQDLSGYIFMQQSPSCGLERVKVYHDNGAPVNGGGRGIYAQAFCAQHPDLPVEEAGRLNDPVLRENFITRVLAYSAWQQVLAEGLSRRANDGLYSLAGLGEAARALRPGGVLAVWSSAPSVAFTARLRKAGFKAEEHVVRARPGKGARHMVWLASR